MAVLSTGQPTVEDVTARFRTMTIEETEFTVACWNIDGAGPAGPRKAVTHAITRQHLQHDIVCLQEVPVTSGKGTFTEYLKYEDRNTYGAVECKEYGRSSKYNMVLYKKEKLKILWEKPCLNKGFALMEVIQKVYSILRGRRGQTYKCTSSTCSECGVGSPDNCILKELKAGRATPQFCGIAITAIDDSQLKKCISQAKSEFERAGAAETEGRYIPPKSLESVTPKVALQRRVAMTLLKPVGTHTYSRILVISIHSYKRKPHNERLNYLLFEFLEMLAVSGQHYPVLVAGDFNQDIREAPSLRPFAQHYISPRYDLTPLRRGLRHIDFILLYQTYWVTFDLTNLQALHFPEIHTAITNHSPLVATMVHV